MDAGVCTEILKSLKEDGVSRVILVGEAGTGKTWMARKTCEYATKDGLEGFCNISLWLSLSKDLDELSLYENIAAQLSLFIDNEEDNIDDDDSEDEEDKNIQDLMRLKDQIHKKLRRKKLKGKGKKYLLLVLDDEGNVTSEEKVMKDLFLGDFLAPYRQLKILLTRRQGEEDDIDSNSEIKSHATDDSHAYSDVEIESHATDDSRAYSDVVVQSHVTDESHLNSHTIDESRTLRIIYTDDYLVELLESLLKEESLEMLHSLEVSWGTNHELLRQHIMRMSMRLPAALVVLAKSINCICQNRSFLVSQDLEEVFKIVNPFLFRSEAASASEGATTGRSRENPILRLSYELLQTDDPLKNSVFFDCFWHSLSFFQHCGCVFYQDLIAHWILEGYFDPVRSVTKAYKDGHTIMTELIRRGLLKIQEGNVVMPETAMKNLTDLRRRGLLGRSRIGLAKVCGSDMTKDLGKTNQVDDIIESVRATRKGEKVTTILVSGNRLRRENPKKFFEKLKDLEILGLFEPKLDPFVPFLLQPVKLQVLVIRNCDLLEDIEELKALQGLYVLEVSGASSLKHISDDFFRAMPKLQSLHLSGLHIKSSPYSISQLKELHRLIIKDCPLLNDLPDIQELIKLEVVDISGARGLQTCFDNTPGDKKNQSKNINLYQLHKPQLLDFSESQITLLPIFQDSAVEGKLHSLTRLLLRNCSKLRRLPSLKPLSGLQILDLSGATSLVKMMEVCFEDKKELRSLNLSGTNLRQLPSTIEELSNLEELLLRDCTNLEVVPNIAKLTNLKVIDVSGSTKLLKIKGSFGDMLYLHMINLSDTKVTIPPELPKKSRNHRLKRIIMADKTPLKGKTWSQIVEKMQGEISESPSSFDAVVKSQEISEKESRKMKKVHWNEPRSFDAVVKSQEISEKESGKMKKVHWNEPRSIDAVVKSQEISEKESGKMKKVHWNEPRSSDCTEKRGISRERFHQVPLNRALYKKTLSFLYSVSQQEVMEVNEINDPGGFAYQDKESLANAEFVSFVNCSYTRLAYVFNEIKSVKGCWLRMCTDIRYLFYEEWMGSLEILSMTNIQSLDNIHSNGSFKNLKKLSIDCCPKIITLFPDSSQVPPSLEFLDIKFCEKLEKVFEEESEVLTLNTVCLYELPVLSAVGAKLPNLETFKVRNCPNLPDKKEDLKGSVEGV